MNIFLAYHIFVKGVWYHLLQVFDAVDGLMSFIGGNGHCIVLKKTYNWVVVLKRVNGHSCGCVFPLISVFSDGILVPMLGSSIVV